MDCKEDLAYQYIGIRKLSITEPVGSCTCFIRVSPDSQISSASSGFNIQITRSWPWGNNIAELRLTALGQIQLLLDDTSITGSNIKHLETGMSLHVITKIIKN